MNKRKIFYYLVILFILVAFIFYSVKGWKEKKVLESDKYCKIDICKINIEKNFTSYLYTPKFHSCFCLNGIYTEKAEKLYWWKV